MEFLVKKIHAGLIKNQKTIAVAESCTGGLLSELLTALPGSSQSFLLGVVTYSNQSKNTVLKIPIQTIMKYGAVSAIVAQKMARAIRKIAKTDFGIGITGIAGPTGATFGKPVGTVFIAIAAKNKNICKKFIFKGTRSAIKKAAALKALYLLGKLLI